MARVQESVAVLLLLHPLRASARNREIRVLEAAIAKVKGVDGGGARGCELERALRRNREAHDGGAEPGPAGEVIGRGGVVPGSDKEVGKQRAAAAAVQ
ncbi:hypothetical protein NL676_024760 [Syzygium grande]|nr:hypothetical protein NL676_024760 [Syzygium grande]